jgi:TRAP-type uncharacterized transport system fused permease subunit
LAALVTGTLGVVALAASLEGQFLRPATWFERVLFMAAAFLLIDPHLPTDAAGLVVLVLGLLSQRLRPAAGPAPEPAARAVGERMSS